MRTVPASARARVQSRLSTAAAAAAFFSSVRREVGMAFLPETVWSFLRLSFFFCLAKYLEDASESQHAPVILREPPNSKALANVCFGPRQVRKVRILLQKSKIERLRKSRESRFLETLAAAILSGPIRRSVVVLVGSDVVPHVSAREAHQRSLKFSCFARKRLLQQYRRKADVLDGSMPDDLRHLGCRRGVAAALGADDAVDDGHADAGEGAELHAVEDVLAGGMLRPVHDDEIGRAADLDNAAIQRAHPRGVAGGKTERDFGRHVAER